MDPNTLSVVQGAAGAGGGGDPVYVEDVFSTDLWLGNATSRSITNDIDLDGEGGMVWIKSRDNDYHHALFDTERGANEYLSSDGTVGITTVSEYLTAFNSDGFTIGTDDDVNENNDDHVSWSFRKAPGFFDIVTYTGNGSTQTVSHNLGSAPGMMIVKRTNSTGEWWVYHKDAGADKPGQLSENYAFFQYTGDGGNAVFQATDPTDEEFYVFHQTTYSANVSGGEYVAYLFADDDQRFGEAGNQSIVKCGSFTGANHTESLGFEPQWLLAKRTDSSGDWFLVDNMRGFKDVSQDSKNLRPNKDEDENTGSFHLTSDGFYYSSSSATYIYTAIRRGPMKTPEDATEVFSADHLTNGSKPGIKAGFPVDLGIFKALTGSSSWLVYDRLRWEYSLYTDKTDDEDASGNFVGDNMIGWYDYSTADSDYIGYSFRRAPEFFDIVCYTATNGNTQHVPHNLGVQPELMLLKSRDATNSWWVYHKDLGADKVIQLESDNSETTSTTWLNDTEPTSSVFTLGSDTGNDGGYANYSTTTYIAYLFATVAGVSKVGSETVGSSAIEVNCGFAAGARFVLIKRTDATGDWYVYDSLRGIASGNDDFLLINEPDDEDSNDYIDPFTTGFKITSSLPSGDYIYLAIA